MTAELRWNRPLPLLFVLYATAIGLAGDRERWILSVAAALPVFLAWILASRNAWLVLFLAAAMATPPLAFGGTDVHPAAIVAAFGLIAGIIRFREWRIERNPLTVTVALLGVVLILSSGLAAIHSGPAIGVGSLARAALAAIAMYVFFYVSAGPGRLAAISPHWLYAAALASAAVACVDFFFPFLAAGPGSQFIWLDSGVYRRAQGFFQEAGALGEFCSLAIIASVVAIAHGVGKRWVLIAGITVFGSALILSFSRASALNAVVALAALAFLERARFSRRGMILAGVAFAVCAGLTFGFLRDFADAYWSRLWFSTTNIFSYAERIFGGRLESWATIAQFLADHPWHAFFGVGYKTLPYSDFIGERVVPDNMYLSMLAETGIAGLALLLMLNWTILRTGYRAARSGDPQRSFYGAVIFCAWAGETIHMFSADVLTFWRILPLYFWVLAMAVWR